MIGISGLHSAAREEGEEEEEEEVVVVVVVEEEKDVTVDCDVVGAEENLSLGGGPTERGSQAQKVTRAPKACALWQEGW